MKTRLYAAGLSLSFALLLSIGATSSARASLPASPIASNAATQPMIGLVLHPIPNPDLASITAVAAVVVAVVALIPKSSSSSSSGGEVTDYSGAAVTESTFDN